MTWPIRTLGDVATWGSGGTPKRSVTEFFGDGIPWLSIADLNDRVVTEAKESLTASGVQNSSAKVVPAGTLLVAMYGSIGKLGIAGMELCTSQAIAFARPHPELVDTRYLFQFLLNERPRLQGRGRGGTQMNISQGDLKAWPIPVPPLDEQRRIVSILDQADAVHAKRRRALGHLDQLATATYAAMFARPCDSWPVEPLGSVTECLDSRRRPVKESERPTGTVPYFGANGQQGWIDRPLFDESLVLVAEDGGHFAAPERGVAYRIDGPAWVNNHAHILRPGPLLTVEYLHRTLRHYDFTPYISGSTRSKLTQKQMKVAEILIPPRALQEEFAFKVARISAHIVALKRALVCHEELVLSLRSRAFSGQL